jgi:hypothetical protein
MSLQGFCTSIENKISEQQQQGIAAAACAAPVARSACAQTAEETLRSLAELGMPEIARPLALGNLQLAHLVLGHCLARFTAPKLKEVKNRAGYVLACLRDPAKFGFVRDVAGDWMEPPDAVKVRAAKRLDATREAIAKREAEEKKAQERMAIETQRIERWNALPEPEKARIRAYVRKERPIFASNDNDSYVFVTSCIRVMEGGSL